MKILVTGASGFVGSRFSRLARAKGHQIVVVSRTPKAGEFDWSERSLGIALSSTDAVVHLAGENLFAGRWSERRKQELIASRVATTEKLVGLAGRRVGVFVCASAVGYYGPSEATGLDESSPPGDDFLATLCQRWESAAAKAADAGVRTALVRLGVVLGPEAGALKQMLPPFKMGIGGPLGSGRQWLSWIHADDTARLLLFVLEHEAASGPFNATAPEPVTMREMARALGRALHRPAFMPVPAFALKLALGEVADVLLTGQHVLPKRALEAGFEFRFPVLEGALQDLLARKSEAAAA